MGSLSMISNKCIANSQRRGIQYWMSLIMYQLTHSDCQTMDVYQMLNDNGMNAALHIAGSSNDGVYYVAS